MKWKHRALILRALAALPGGGAAYQLLQNAFGEFRRPDFVTRRFVRQRTLAQAALDNGGCLSGARLLEVGTGWVPLVPLGFWFCGAASTVTFDLNRYFSPSLTRRCLRWMAANPDALVENWRGLVTEDQVREKLVAVDRLKERPTALLAHAGIELHAPADAARTHLDSASIDLHYSANVLEHVHPEALREILREAHRLLDDDGLAVHHVDPSDHFAHADPSIPRIHFLSLDETRWRRYYGNRFAYLNRWHDSDYRRLFAELSFQLLDCRFDLDRTAMDLLSGAFPLAEPFRAKDREDLCRANLTYVATPGAAPSNCRSDG